MQIRGSKWSMSKRKSRRANPFTVILLLLAIGAVFLFDRTVAPTIPSLFEPTPTITQPPETYISSAEQLASTGKLKQAIDAYKQAMIVDPKNASIYINKAKLEIYTTDYQGALNDASNALLINPKNSAALAVQGWAYNFLGDYAKAQEALQNAITEDPNNAAAYAYLSETLLNVVSAGTGQLSTMDQAIAYSKTAQTLSPNSLETHRARGLVLENTSNYEEAVAEFKAAIAINDNIADLHLALGRNYRATQNYDEAINEFSRALALNPNDSTAYTLISRTYFTNGDHTKALQYAEDALKISPTDPYLYGNEGLIYWKITQYQNAVDVLRLAINGGVNSAGQEVKGLPLDYGRVGEFYYTYGLALSKLGQCGEALPLAQSVAANLTTDEIAQYNAQEIINTCEQLAKSGGVVTPTPQLTPKIYPTITPLVTSTP
jgi:tetratricopeptide (TPR) repeat protein